MAGIEQGSPETAASAAPSPEAATSLSAAAADSGARERSPGPDSAGSSTAEGLALTPRQELEMRAYRNARYHDDRLAHFERLTRWSNFGLIVLGSAALAGVIQTFAGASGQHSDIGAVLAIGGTSISAIVSAGQLAFDWSAKARAHSELRRAFSKIMAKAANTRLDTDEINAEMVELYGDEFEVYHAVNALAYNAAQRAFDRKDKIYELSWWQAVTRHIRHQDTRNFQLVDDPT